MSTEASTEKTAESHCWLETTARPPVRNRTTDLHHRKISTQIICQDIEDETPFVKLVLKIDLKTENRNGKFIFS